MRRVLRIGYVIGALDPAGSERQMLALAERLPRDRFAPEFLLLTRAGPLAERAVSEGVPVTVVPPPIREGGPPAVVRAGRVVRKAANFVRLVRQRRIDIVDAWLFHAYLLAALARPLSRQPVLVTGRRGLTPREASGRAGRLLRRYSVFMSDVVVANSDGVRDWVIAEEDISPSKVRVIRNGVVIPPLGDGRQRNALRAELGLATDAFAIGSVANLLPGKGHDLLLPAFAGLVARYPEARLVLVGDGLLRDDLERRASDLGIRETVVFVGSVPDAPRLLPAFDAFVQASMGEGLPNATLEAAAAGRPIVATAVGGTPEIVRHDDTGLLVPSGDGTALEEAMARLVRAPELGARLGAAARQVAEREFGMDRFVGEFAELYLELADRRKIR